MNRIQRAAKLARLQSATRHTVPFADTSLMVHELIEKRKHQGRDAAKPIVIVDDSGKAMLCNGDRTRFLFSSLAELPMDYGQVRDLYETDLVSIKYLSLRVAHGLNRSPLVQMRNLAIKHIQDPIALTYIAHVASTIDFRTKTMFCSRCGTPVQLAFSRVCPKCGLEKYPRQSPVAIVLVHDAETDAVLLGRRPESPVWSLLAGFCEPLESIENCAVREIHEESGVNIDRVSVEIAVTQPWPFFAEKFEGSSFMVGCFAQVTEGRQVPKPQIEELEEVKWFSSQELHELWRSHSPLLPMKTSMARYLLSCFLTEFHAESKM